MKNESNFFIRKRVDITKLIRYGFKLIGTRYVYKTFILDNQFELTVEIKDDEVNTLLYDIENEDEYILHILKDAQGEFIGSVRTAYYDVIEDIRDKCYINDIFKSENAREIIKYVKEKYDTPLEFLWEKLSDSAIYRRKDNNKWYAVLLKVEKNKLGLEGKGIVEIIDLKMQSENLKEIVDHKSFFPGYHMNKKYWYTIILDGTVSNETIFSLIDKSYEIVGSKKIK